MHDEAAASKKRCAHTTRTHKKKQPQNKPHTKKKCKKKSEEKKFCLVELTIPSKKNDFHFSRYLLIYSVDIMRGRGGRGRRLDYFASG